MKRDCFTWLAGLPPSPSLPWELQLVLTPGPSPVPVIPGVIASPSSSNVVASISCRADSELLTTRQLGGGYLFGAAGQVHLHADTFLLSPANRNVSSVHTYNTDYYKIPDIKITEILNKSVI